MDPSHTDWAKLQMDKLILVMLVCLGLLVLLHIVHHPTDISLVGWVEQLISGFSGALLVLLTGRSQVRPPNGNGTKTEDAPKV